MKKLLLPLTFSLLLAIPAGAQFTFEKFDGSTNEDDEAREIIKIQDGGFALVGKWVMNGFTSTDPFLRKTNALGQKLWQKTYSGTGNGDAFGVIQNDDGGYTLLVYWSDLGAYLLKTDSIGEVLWQKKVSPIAAEAFIKTNDGGYAVAEWDPPGVYIGLIRTDFEGDTLWTRRYLMPGQCNAANDLIETSDGGFALTGSACSAGTSNQDDNFLLKTDANGIFQWLKQFGTLPLNEEGNALLQTPDGGYLVAGTVEDGANDQTDAQLTKTNSAGVLSWTKKYNYDPTGYLYQVEDMAPTSDGNYIICGWGCCAGAYGFLLKINQQGDTLFKRTFEGQGVAALNSVFEDVDGQFVCSGATWSSLNADSDIYYFKTGFPVGTKDLPEADIRIAPNPVEAGQSVRIVIEDLQAYNLTLFDALGRLIWQKSGESRVMNVPAPAQRGIYALVATTADGRFVGRYLLDVQ